MGELFRPEVPKYAAKKLAGTVILESSFGFRLISYVVAGCILVVATYACLVTFSRTQQLNGWLVPSTGFIRVPAAQGGIVEQVFTSGDATVSEGDRIARLNISFTVDGGDAAELTGSSNMTQVRSVQRATEAHISRINAESNDVQRQIPQIGLQILEAKKRSSLQEQRLQIAKALVQRLEGSVAQGYVARQEFEQVRMSVLATESELSNSRDTVLSLEQTLAAAKLRLKELAAEEASERATLDQQLSVLADRDVENRVKGRYYATAPATGLVSAISVAPGKYVRPGDTIATITPANSVVVAELYAPSEAVGFVRVGQRVRIKFSAYPYQRFGMGAGTVTAMTAAPIGSEDVPFSPAKPGEPLFKLRVRLDKDTIYAYGTTFPLRAGMLVAADVVLERQSLIKWLLDPIYAARASL